MITIMPNPFFQRLDEMPNRVITLKRGAQVFERGDAVTLFHRVISGQVHLLRRQLDGGTFILQRAQPGHFLAEASLSTPCFHCAAEAVAPSTLKTWPAAAVRHLLEHDSHAAGGYALHLASQLRAARMRGEILSLRRVAERLDAWLAWHDGRLPPKGEMAHLAHDLNISAEALYRELSRRRAGSLKSQLKRSLA